jgi:hypothetical protein
MPVVLATQRAEIRRTEIGNQPQANNLGDPILKKNPSQKTAGGVAQVVRGGVGPELSSNPSTTKKKKY